MKKAVAFIPELKMEGNSTKRIELASNLYFLPASDELAVNLRQSIIEGGYTISDGVFLYFEGNLKKDGTLYEIFRGYCFALTFFYPDGMATCRAMKEVGDSTKVELFIDEYDKFNCDPDDLIELKRSDVASVAAIFPRVEMQLETGDFNPMRNSLEFFILFLSEKQIRTRLLYLSICLESILLEGDSEGVAYKLGVRCAHLLSAFRKDADLMATYNEMKDSYSLRSKIIHGSDYKKESERIIHKRKSESSELDHIWILEEIVKNIFSIIFSNQNLYDLSCKGQLGTLVDQRYILNGGKYPVPSFESASKAS